MKLAASLADTRSAGRAAMPGAGQPPRTHLSAEPAPRREHIVERKYVRISLFSGLVLAVAGALLAQDTPEQGAAQKSATTFVVNGKTVDAQVLNVDGRSYVDVDSLTQIAQITNGSITVEPNRIVLTIPASSSNAPTAALGQSSGCGRAPSGRAGAVERVCDGRDRRSRGNERVEGCNRRDDHVRTRRKRSLGAELS